MNGCSNKHLFLALLFDSLWRTIACLALGEPVSAVYTVKIVVVQARQGRLLRCDIYEAAAKL